MAKVNKKFKKQGDRIIAKFTRAIKKLEKEQFKYMRKKYVKK